MTKKPACSEKKLNDDASFVRQWGILRTLLTHKEGKTVKELARENGVCDKTIRNDLVMLATVAGNFRTVSERHGEKRYSLDELLLNFDARLSREELLAFAIGRRLMTPLMGTRFWSDLESGYEKIENVLDCDSIEYVERVAPFFCQFAANRYDYGDKEKIITNLFRALEDNRVARIHYKSLDVTRMWKIDRFHKVQLTRDHFTRPADFKMEEFLAPAQVPFKKREKPCEARVLFDRLVAQAVMEDKEPTIVKRTKRRNGDMVANVTVGQTSIFFSWLV